MRESEIMKRIQLALSKVKIMMFRNNTGAYKTEAGHYVRFGVGERGGSDLIGLTPITITSEMVGRKIAAFTAIEVKTNKGKPTKEQLSFIAAIQKQGGISGIARSVDDALEIIEAFKNGGN